MTWLADDLTYRYPGASRDAVADVALAVEAGEMVAILGPNGSGKSTLLRLLVGALVPDRGVVRLLGTKVDRWDRRELAKVVGVLPQHEVPVFPITAREVAVMGRYPHLGSWRRPGDDDVQAVQSALERCGVADLEDRFFSTLSGGERQRVRLSRALAQEPKALALDEPTTSLDIAHEMEIWALLSEQALSGLAVLLTTHNLNLAARFADRLIVLDEGRVAAAGPPAAVLTADTIRRVYRWPMKVLPHPGPGDDTGAPQVVPIRRHSTQEIE